MQLQKQWDQFASQDVFAIAVAQEDEDLESHGRFYKPFGDDRPFEIVADLEGKTLGSYERTATYLIDEKGVVREVFPALIHMRPSWFAVRNRLQEIVGAADAKRK